MKCEICGKEIGNVKFEYSTPDEKLKMVVCEDCAKRKKEVELKWKEKKMLMKK